MYQYSFQKLEVYQLAKKLASEVYKISSNFPMEEKFGLTNQLRRAAVSVALNLAEGVPRFSNKDKIRFIEISYGSLMEVIACFEISVELGFITKDQSETSNILIKEISNKLNALKRSFQDETKPKQLNT